MDRETMDEYLAFALGEDQSRQGEPEPSIEEQIRLAEMALGYLERDIDEALLRGNDPQHLYNEWGATSAELRDLRARLTGEAARRRDRAAHDDREGKGTAAG